jgi:hypothetical protein
MVLGREECPVAARRVFMLSLHACGFEVAFVSPSLLFTSGTSVDSTTAPVVADPVHRDVVDHRLVVDVNVRDGDVVNSSVVIEISTPPISALVARAKVAESVIHATVKSDVRSPISRMPDISAFAPTPIARGPEHTDRGRYHPCAWHPVVALYTISPVAWCPHITVAGTRRLRVNG